MCLRRGKLAKRIDAIGGREPRRQGKGGKRGDVLMVLCGVSKKATRFFCLKRDSVCKNGEK